MSIELLWPTPIYYDITKNAYLIQKEIDNIYDQLKFETVQANWGSTVRVTDPSFKEDLISKMQLKTLKEYILTSLQEYSRMLNVNFDLPFKMHSWMTLSERGEYSKVHSHGYADISGVYYYKTNGEDGNLFFETPLSQAESSFMFARKCSDIWVHKPVVGKIILFPGWLRHGVTQNNTDSVRNSISFNIILDKFAKER